MRKLRDVLSTLPYSNAQLLYDFAAALAHIPLCHRRTCCGDPWNVRARTFTRNDRESVLYSPPPRGATHVPSPYRGSGREARGTRAGWGASVTKMVERDTRSRDTIGYVLMDMVRVPAADMPHLFQ